ncbi:Chemotaxis protein CheA [Planctomycetes bacterium Poly30]|uniref:Chemotaxis protein CheA n=1 Tax=Saltatorellus ferox TaxID=2528018 RepID=A0A518EKA3_9BACT|nr:Chemotaxis protein CheA [Planctomycetes bacterium Poly30]
MSAQQNLDALVWAAAVNTTVDAKEAAEIQDHARSLVESGDASVPEQLRSRLDELVDCATRVADGDAKASKVLRALLRTLMVGDEEDSEEQPASASVEEDADEDLMALFLSAASEALLEIETAVLALESPEDDEIVDEATAALKRDIHTLKGECGVLSLHTAQAVWHEAETLIDVALTAGRNIPVDPLMAALDWHREHLALLSEDGSSRPPAHEHVLEKLSAAQAEDHPAPAPASQQKPASVEEAAPTPSESKELPPEEAPEENGTLVTFSDDLLGDETVPEFVTEARQHLEDSEAALFELEEDAKSSDGIDRIFRAFHTIKGVAGFLGIKPITDLAHVIETLLDRFRSSDLDFTSAHADIVLESKDMMERLFEALLGGEGPPAHGLERLIQHAAKVAEDPAAAGAIGARAVRNVLASAGIKDEKDIHRASLDPAKTTSQLGAILVSKGAMTEDQLAVALARQEALREQGQQMRLGEVLVLLGVVSQGQLEIALEIQGNRTPLGKLLEAEVKPPSPESLATKAESKKKAKFDSTIRVSTQRLDSLVDMVGELVIAQQMVVQGTESENVAADDQLVRNLALLGKITRDLQEASMSLRMVTFQSTFQKMHRLVRDVASKAGKSIRLEIQGADTEVDRNVVDKISDPLVHLVRNAIDHGVEPPDERQRVGKDPQGTVILAARHQGGAIVISLKDNGRGLDRNKIAAKAKEKGLIPMDKDVSEMSDSAIFKMIFEPGFSTAAAVTDISGRGVGMDVVKRNIEAMRGKVEIFSTYGQGAEFQIQLPLTLAIIDAMIVRCGTQRYVIPTLSIVQSFRPTAAQTHAIQGDSPVVDVRGQLVPMHRLDHILDGYGDQDGERGSTTLILVEGMGRRVCLAVDEIIGQQQVVIKKLGPCTPPARVISGGAILGDGRVALIVDIEGVLAETESVALC